MKLIKITKSGALHFKLSDGRIGLTYPTGYVRVSVKGINSRLYQINKMIKVPAPSEWNRDDYWHRRVLITNCVDRVQCLLDFDNNNCK
jgi:hypothetical protein